MSHVTLYDLAIMPHGVFVFLYWRTSVCVWFQLRPQLDVLTCIKEAVQAQKLVLTTPWVVKYLSMIDLVSAHLPYYRIVFKQLIHLYRDLRLSGRASFLIRLLLGWLFESSDFLEGLFYTWRQDLSSNKSSVPGLIPFPTFIWFYFLFSVIVTVFDMVDG